MRIEYELQTKARHRAVVEVKPSVRMSHGGGSGIDPVRGVIYLVAFSYLAFRTYQSLRRLEEWQIASTSETRCQNSVHINSLIPKIFYFSPFRTIVSVYLCKQIEMKTSQPTQPPVELVP